ncbi:glycoside hydrolase family 31 protein [Thermothelomyces thermophilus ATCC 42464]|uniref:alpha-glucosidase n=1 Tax=Thermothelomyces thermophilus (strain ATCC 42464 / BCRC 31852 / DSM 1799) TaxID=573729 RepID=G2Q8V0_THET4|nr:glycoside hydrolase family 31 protein [Thermothelomyces thermophilus ATCC 42464]AEO56295.1 glycoside hydrolase family 31 protein [Thermothelomyces thermophilus ATCC 42464]
MHVPGPLSSRWTAYLGLLSAFSAAFAPAVAVKEHDFKKCHQSGFCKRNREFADHALATSSWASPYNVAPDSGSFKDGQYQAVILKTTNSGETVWLPITVSFLESGTARVTVDEEKRQKGEIELRHGSKARKERYNEAEKWAIVGGMTLDKEAKVDYEDKTQITVKYGPTSKFEATIKFSPFSIDFKRDGISHVKLNDQGLLNIEHWRPKVDKPEPEKKDGDSTEENKAEEAKEEPKGEDESTWWEETFGGNTDTKPRGPESVGLDISFVGYEHVYGIPSHASSLSLKQTRGGEGNYQEPYRMYNADVFEYILDSPMTLYGSIPFMQAHRKDSSVGVFWLNAAETWVDITKAKDSKNPLSLGGKARTNTHTHWFSESGLLDVFVFLGPTPKDLTARYGELTGTTAMPQEFALGYHQCRWNYVSDEDVRDVDRKMDKFKMPYDVIWLDIEYTDEKKYFTWDKHSFTDPIGMGKQLDSHGRKLVTIIDPHIKNTDNYPVVAELKSKELGVKNKDGNLFEGWCWPGSSHWIDAFSPAAREWWSSLFKYDKFKGTMENTWIWNDMNEPSVFNGPETTMPKDNLHDGNWEHRDVHNLNGLTFHNATYHALLTRKPGELRRPFVLTRSFFAGSQRVGAMWTGDNQAAWDHLKASIPMVLSQGISGFPFSGADVGGFFGNPEKELLTRWYQAGAFYPFFRGHAHIDARRREPYLAGEPYTTIIAAALRLRYSLLPSWYTAFRHAHLDGTPIIKPMFYTHPSEEAGLAIEDQFFVGNTGLLAKPVTEKEKTTVDVWIPDGEVYYDYFTYQVIPTVKGKTVTLDAPMEKIPLLMRGGHVFARRDVPRRSSALMRWDDYTLVVTVPRENKVAEGDLYVDDGDSFEYQNGQYIHRRFVYDGAAKSLSSVDAEGRDAASIREGAWMKQMRSVGVGKIVVVGAPASWAGKKSVKVESEGKVWEARMEFTPAGQGRAAFAVIKKVGVRIGADWKVEF